MGVVILQYSVQQKAVRGVIWCGKMRKTLEYVVTVTRPLPYSSCLSTSLHSNSTIFYRSCLVL